MPPILAQTTPPPPSVVEQLFQTFLNILTLLINFVMDTLVPPSIAEVNIIHVAIWLPVTIGLLSLVIALVRGFWSRRGRAA
ncbi:MAG TPA: hypothetical protein VFS21_09060 [Roseiflexaceae bacterium]|nr:hypothetical protein [Roseiflexaceae bacterium]